MASRQPDRASTAPLDLGGLPLWLVERGMRGLPLGEQLAGFCQRIHDAGFPMKRALLGMSTLHPRYGAHTFVWRPGAEAIEQARELDPDLILLDIEMPVMDGIELARRASEIDPEMKIMFITGFAAVALNAANQAPEDAKVLSKPFHLRDLVNQVDRMLAA